MNEINFGLTANDYATHRAGFPPSFYSALLDAGVDGCGKRILDLGTGTGTLARGFAARGASVIGIDPSQPMLTQAQALAKADGVDVDFRIGAAEQTGVATSSMDIITAGQCWHWFDPARAAAECMRVLEPHGVIVIGNFDWIPLPGNVVEASEQLIVAHNPDWRFGGGTGIHGRHLSHLARAGFKELTSRSYDEWPQYSHAAWRGRIRASAGVGATLSPEAVEVFDRQHAALLSRDFPDEPLEVHHRVYIVIGHKPGPARRS